VIRPRRLQSSDLHSNAYRSLQGHLRCKVLINKPLKVLIFLSSNVMHLYKQTLNRSYIYLRGLHTKSPERAISHYWTPASYLPTTIVFTYSSSNTTKSITVRQEILTKRNFDEFLVLSILNSSNFTK